MENAQVLLTLSIYIVKMFLEIKMKYTNILKKLGRFLFLTLIFVVTVLSFPAIIIGLTILEFTILPEVSIAVPILMPVCILVSAMSWNWFLAWYNNARFINTGYVRDGRSVIDVVRDAAYFKRATIVYYVHSAISLVFSIYLIVRYIVAIEPGFGFILGVVVLIVESVLYFIFAKSSKEKQKLEENKN